MGSIDFSAKQIRVSKIIASGGVGSAQLLIYSASDASDMQGGLSKESLMSASFGNDVFLFVENNCF